MAGAAQDFPVVGMTTVSWGFGLGAILLLVAVALRIAAGLIMRSSPDLQEKTAGQPATQQLAPPPPSAVTSSVST